MNYHQLQVFSVNPHNIYPSDRESLYLRPFIHTLLIENTVQTPL
jgi:hypothetical protein